MFTWVAENVTGFYWLLAMAALALAAGWYLVRNGPSRGNRPPNTTPYLVGMVVVGALVVAVWTINHLTDTDSKQITRALEAMAAGVSARNVDQIFAHISDSFARRAEFRRFVDDTLRQGAVSAIRIWDIDVKEISPDRNSATVFFRGKAEGSTFQQQELGLFNCTAVFTRDDDGHWRMRSFKVSNAISTEPIPLPFG